MRITLALISLLLLAAPASGQDADAENANDAPITLIRCGWLLTTPGEADPIRDAVVVVEGDRITQVAQGRTARRLLDGDADRVIDLSDRYVLPGLIDCHTHITSEMGPKRELRFVQETEADTALRAAVYAERTLQAGFTTIRNVGSRGDAAFALRDAINAGRIPGPRILVAGRAITPTGGHGDTDRKSVV